MPGHGSRMQRFSSGMHSPLHSCSSAAQQASPGRMQELLRSHSSCVARQHGCSIGIQALFAGQSYSFWGQQRAPMGMHALLSVQACSDAGLQQGLSASMHASLHSFISCPSVSVKASQSSWVIAALTDPTCIIVRAMKEYSPYWIILLINLRIVPQDKG